MDMIALKSKFSAHLHGCLTELLASYPAYKDYTMDYVETGGKQVRPLLFLEACEIFGTTIDEDTLQLACAIELLHNFFLIHDDIMDNDEMRRDKQTLHVHFSKNTSEVAGRAIALVIGDILYTHALQLLDQHSPKNISSLMLRDTLAIAAETAKGQLLEFTSHEIPKKSTILEFYKKKTAEYSIHLPLLLATHLSSKDTDKEYFPIIQGISSTLGIAYQLYDDLIEIIGTKKRFEHTDRCADIMRAKMTPLLIDVLPFLDISIQKNIYTAHTNQTTLDVQTEAMIIETMKKQKILDSTITEIHAYLDSAEIDMKKIGLEKSHIISSLLSSYRNAPTFS